MVTGQILPGNLRRNPLIVLGFLLLFVLAGYKTAGFILAGDTTGLALAAIAVAVGALVFAIISPALAVSAEFAAVQPAFQFQQSLQQPSRQSPYQTIQYPARLPRMR